MFLTALAAIALAAPPVTVPEASKAAAPVIRLWISDDRQFVPGDRVRVQVETGASGYLLVLRFDAEGNLRVLFPVDPGDDGSVQAGRRYELRDPGAGQSFLAEDFGGAGLIFAALSSDPFNMESFLGTGGGWDYGALKIAIETENPEAELTTLVQQMASTAGFDYDVLDYWVDGPMRRVGAAGVARPTWWSPDYESYGTYGSATTLCGSCPYSGGSSVYLSVGFGFGFGWYDPYWYNPYYYSYFPGGWYYPPYWNSGGYYPPHVGYPSNYPRVIGRTRDYTVERPGSRPRPHDPSGPNGARQAGDVSAGSNQGPARRARGQGSTGSQGPFGGSTGGTGRSAQPRSGENNGSGTVAQPKGGNERVAPPATRARPRGDRPATGNKPAAEQRIASGNAGSNPMNGVRSRPTSNRQEVVRVNPANGQRNQGPAPQARKVDRGGSKAGGSAASQARSRSGVFRNSNLASGRQASPSRSGFQSPSSATARSSSSGRSSGGASAGRSSGGSSRGSAPRARARP